VRHQPRKTHWRVALHPPSTTLPLGAWSPLARVRPDARRRPRRRVATGLERTRLRRPRQSRSGANGRRPPGPTQQPAPRPLNGARRRPGPSRTRHRLGLHSHTSPPPRPLDGARRSTSRPRVDRRLGRRPRGPAGSGRPDPVRRAARRQPGPAGSGRPACGLSFTYSVTLTLHSTLITPVRPHPPRPALAQRRSGTPPVVQPGHGSSPHAGPRASYQVAVSQTAAPSGSPLRPGRKGDPEPHRLPSRAAGIRLVPGSAQGLSLRTARPQL